MKLVKVENKDNGTTRYVSSRIELKEMIGISEQSISRISKILSSGGIANTKNYIIRTVEIDESSIKEVV